MEEKMNSIPPLSNGEVIYEGWLLKRGEHIKNWRQRYFVLFKSGSLLGFKNKPNDYSGDPLNDFTVKDVQLMRLEKPKANTFLVRGLHFDTVVERMFCAETAELRDAWINAIKAISNSIKLENGGGGGNPGDPHNNMFMMMDTSLFPQSLDYFPFQFGEILSPYSSASNESNPTNSSNNSCYAADDNNGSASMLTVEAAGAAQFLELEQEAMSASNHLCQQQQQNGGVVSSSRNLAAAAVGAIISPAKNKSVRSKIGLNSFEFIKVLGKGTFGKVILCREKRTSKLYAMKILKKEMIIAKDEVEHTLTENRVLQRCRHPFLTELTYSFQTQDRLCFVMEFANGGDLYYHLNRQMSRHPVGFTESRTCFYGAEMVLALGYLHDNNIVYRDLKLENLLLDRDGHLKIADFGLCKEDISYHGRTRTFCGTPEYLAPEVLEENDYGRAVDWWGVGVVMYEMMCGRLPFYEREHEKLFDLIMKCSLKFPHRLSPQARSLLSGLLTKDPSARLGGGLDDYKEVKRAPFFDEIDWDKLFRKELEPPFKPQLESELDISYFDLEFTRETVQLTPPAATSQQGKLLETLDEMDENDEFVQFSFQREEDHPFPISTTTLAQNNNNGGGGSERMEVVENNEEMCA